MSQIVTFFMLTSQSESIFNMFRWSEYTFGEQSLLRFFLLVSMCDGVAEWLVVDVASRVDGSESEGLISLEIYEVTVYLVRIIILQNFKRVSHYKEKKHKPPLL